MNKWCYFVLRIFDKTDFHEKEVWTVLMINNEYRAQRF